MNTLPEYDLIRDVTYISKEGEKDNSCHKNSTNFPGTCRCAQNIQNGLKKNNTACPRTYKYGVISFRDSETRDIYASNREIFLNDLSILPQDKVDIDFDGELPFLIIDQVQPLEGNLLGVGFKVNLTKN